MGFLVRDRDFWHEILRDRDLPRSQRNKTIFYLFKSVFNLYLIGTRVQNRLDYSALETTKVNAPKQLSGETPSHKN